MATQSALYRAPFGPGGSSAIDAVLAARGHRNVRATGVPAGERPVDFAVSNEVNAREPVLPVDYLFAPHFQFRISGRSWSLSAMNCLCSIIRGVSVSRNDHSGSGNRVSA